MKIKKEELASELSYPVANLYDEDTAPVELREVDDEGIGQHWILLDTTDGAAVCLSRQQLEQCYDLLRTMLGY